MRGPKPSEYVSTRMPIRRASSRCPASWAAMSRPRPTTATTMAMKRGSIAHAPPARRHYVEVATCQGVRMRRTLIAVCGSVLAAACSSQKPAAKVDDAGLARLNEAQMEPVDEARVEEGRARDVLARARATEADARARLEVARSERSVSEAQLKRAQAEKDLLKRQYASKDQMAEIDQEIAGSQDRLKATDLKLQYLQQMIGVAEAERRVAESHVITTQTLTEQTKYRAMKAGNAPEAGSVNARHQIRACFRPAGIHGGNGVLARIPPRVRVGEQLRDQLDFEAGFLPGLAPAGDPNLLAPVDEAAGDGPASRLVPAQDEDDAAIRSGDDRIGGGKRIALLLAHGVTSPDGVAGRGAAFCSIRPLSACVKSARQNGFIASFSSARDTASAVRAASGRSSEARTWPISTRRFA